MGTVLVDDQEEVRLCDFASPFDRLAEASTFVLNANSSEFPVHCCRTLSIKSVTDLINP